MTNQHILLVCWCVVCGLLLF